MIIQDAKTLSELERRASIDILCHFDPNDSGKEGFFRARDRALLVFPIRPRYEYRSVGYGGTKWMFVAFVDSVKREFNVPQRF
jgi:hypothetical protein